MNERPPEPPGRDTAVYVLRASAPLRALAVAAACELAGAILLVTWSALDLPIVVAVLGALLLAFGSALFVAAVVSFSRFTQTVEVSDTGIRLRSRQQTRALPWAAIQQVSRDGARLTLKTDPDQGQPMELVNPQGAPERQFAALISAIHDRLEADRGYRPLS